MCNKVPRARALGQAGSPEMGSGPSRIILGRISSLVGACWYRFCSFRYHTVGGQNYASPAGGCAPRTPCIGPRARDHMGYILEIHIFARYGNYMEIFIYFPYLANICISNIYLIWALALGPMQGLRCFLLLKQTEILLVVQLVNCYSQSPTISNANKERRGSKTMKKL